VSVADTQNNIAVVLKEQGKLEEALELYQKSLDTRIRAVGPDHASVADTMQNIGIVHGSMGDQASAKECYRKAHAIYQAAFGADHPTTRGLAPFI
jgi:tetratricopeptide (TPR) repeat protein